MSYAGVFFMVSALIFSASFTKLARASVLPEDALDNSIEVIREAASQKSIGEIKATLAEAWGPRLLAVSTLESVSAEALTALARTSFRKTGPTTVEVAYEGGKVQIAVLDAERGEFLINGRQFRVTDYKTHAKQRQAIERIVQKTVSIPHTNASGVRDWGMVSSADDFMGTAVTDSILSAVIDLMVAGVGSS